MSEKPSGSMPFRRLDARMLLVHPVQEAVRFLPALVALFVTGRSSDRSPLWDLGALVVVIVLGMSRWFTTRYRISGGQIELRSGLFTRKVLATPADRVRTVDVTAPIWHRLVGLARVEIGTGSSRAMDDRIVLDALAAPVAQALRAELLHRAATLTPPTPASGSGAVIGEDGQPSLPSPAQGAIPVDLPPPSGSVPVDLPPPPVEQDLMTLNPRWIAYAPLTTSGLLTALAVWGFVSQYLVDLIPTIESAVGQVQAWGVWISLAVGVLMALAAIAGMAITAYVLQFWGFRLSRHSGGTLHVTRGLLTTHATSLEEARIRGLEIGEPLGLRWAKAGRLHAIGTGLRSGDGAERGRAWLVPPAPRDVVVGVARLVLGRVEPLDTTLEQHGPAARRRRYVRAVVPAALLAGLATWGWVRGDLPGLVTLTAYLPLVVSPLLARDRYAALGHALTADYVVARSGSIERRRDVVARAGVVGVVTRATFFQRRAGVATVVVATAAGRQGYRILDVPAERSEELVVELVPQARAFCDSVSCLS